MSAATPSPVPWGDFTVDPRHPDAAPLRASDRDRAVVMDVLANGYAEGRLTREEHDERAQRTVTTKTLGELPQLISDLVPVTGSRPSHDLAAAGPDDLRRQAEQRWAARMRQALTGMLVPSLICWTIWLAVLLGHGAHHAVFPWPVFVTLGTGANLLRLLGNKHEIIEQEQRRLEKKQRKALQSDRAGGAAAG